METPTVYVICDQNCKFESMTKEQILAAIVQAVETGTISNIDTGFVQTIKTVNGKALKFFVGAQSEYDALTEENKKDLFAIITNDATKEGLLNAISTLQDDLADLEKKLTSGSFVVEKSASLKLGAPVLNSEKKLTESGFYYIEYGNGGVRYSCGIVYWNGIAVNVQNHAHANTISTQFELLILDISKDGNITMKHRNEKSDGTVTTEDITGSFSIYIAKIGE